MENFFRPANIKKAVLGRDSFFQNTEEPSGGERSATATGAFGIRIVESKPAIVEAVYKVNFHTKQVNGMSLVHNDIDSVDFIPVIGVLGLVETKHVGETGTAASLDTYPEAVVGRNILLMADLHQLLGRLLRDSYRSCNSSAFFIHYCVHIR